MAERASLSLAAAPRSVRMSRVWPITQAALVVLFRRRLLWVFLLLGLMNFLFHFAVVYLVAQLDAQVLGQNRFSEALSRRVRDFLFTGSGESYRNFIFTQNIVLMFFLGFAGSIVVGGDFRSGSVAFYLAKPIAKLHYFLGKLLCVSGLGALLTLLPALILFAEYGLFGPSFDYFTTHQRVFWAIVAYGAAVSLTIGMLLIGVSAAFQRPLPILGVWTALFVFLPLVAETLRNVSSRDGGDAWGWALLDVWAVLRWLSGLFFGVRAEAYEERLPWAILTLITVWGASTWIFFRRVRAVEVVS